MAIRNSDSKPAAKVEDVGGQRIPIGLRVLPADLDEIDRRAEEHRMSRTEYMVRCSLGELGPDVDMRAEMAQIQERLARIEELTFEQTTT